MKEALKWIAAIVIGLLLGLVLAYSLPADMRP